LYLLIYSTDHFAKNLKPKKPERDILLQQLENSLSGDSVWLPFTENQKQNLSKPGTPYSIVMKEKS
jgi:hypothetical protein